MNEDNDKLVIGFMVGAVVGAIGTLGVLAFIAGSAIAKALDDNEKSIEQQDSSPTWDYCPKSKRFLRYKG